jgi:Excalibur calcium-binding domain
LVLAVAAVAAGAAWPLCQTTRAKAQVAVCGVERWAVKTLQDRPAGTGDDDRTSGQHAPSTPVINFKRSNRLYLQNRGLDRDKDGIVCEKL